MARAPVVSSRYIDELFIKGQKPGSAEPVAWYVKIGRIVTDENGKAIETEQRMMNMVEAAAAGFTLANIVSELNTAIMQQVDTVTVERDKLAAENEVLQQRLNQREPAQ